MKRPGEFPQSSQYLYIVAGLCAIAIIIGMFVWSWRVVTRQDAESGRHGLVTQLMNLKTQAMEDLRDGLATANYRQLEKGVAQLRDVNNVASAYLSDTRYGQAGSDFRRTLEQFARDVQDRQLPSAQRSFDTLAASCVECHQREPNVPLDDDWKPRRVGLPDATGSASAAAPSDA